MDIYIIITVLILGQTVHRKNVPGWGLILLIFPAEARPYVSLPHLYTGHVVMTTEAVGTNMKGEAHPRWPQHPCVTSFAGRLGFALWFLTGSSHFSVLSSIFLCYCSFLKSHTLQGSF